MSVLESDHPLNPHINALTDQLTQFQISGKMGYRFLVRPVAVRSAFERYARGASKVQPATDDYLRSATQEVIDIITQPRNVEALNDTAGVGTPNDFIILTRQQFHLTKEQAILLAALYYGSLRNAQVASTH